MVFAGQNKVIELSLQAESQEVFASGAVKAAKFMASVTSPGMYDMSDLIAALDK